jgi:site-specific DNA recombinase
MGRHTDILINKLGEDFPIGYWLLDALRTLDMRHFSKGSVNLMYNMEVSGIDVSGRLRAAIYARFSSPNQRLTSLEDQERNCREVIEGKNWIVIEEYVMRDASVSGTSMLNRPGLQSLLRAAKTDPRPFDYLVIDSTSRLNRNLGDILQLTERLQFHGVKLHFAAQGLDSANESIFRSMLTIVGLNDEMSSKFLANNVHRGQKGRVLEGYTSGSRCFGYTSVRVLDPSSVGGKGQSTSLGSRLKVIPEEAETIIRIGEMFAGGVSVHQIEKILTAEKVPAARKPRIGDVPSSWNSCLINRILRNQKYVGVVLWNQTKQFKDPETGAIETRKKRQDEIVRVELPHLRIIPEDLWDRIQARIKIVDEKVKPHRLGGMNKAENKTYLFSGLLECGVCGGPIIITGGKGCEASYGCRAARYQRGCTNKLRVRADRLTAQLVEALAERVLTPEFIDCLVVSVCRELNDQFEESRKQAIAGGTDLPQLKLDLECQQRNVVNAIAIMRADQSIALTDKLATISEEIKDVVRRLWMAQTGTKHEVSLDEVRVLVEAMAKDLLRVCQADVDKAKSIMQKHIDLLILIPMQTPDGPVYEVTGAMEMFPTSDVVLDGASTHTSQQYDSYKFGFAGVIIDPRLEGDDEEAPVNVAALRDLLVDLLGRLPHLQGQLLTAGQWRAQILAATKEHGRSKDAVLRPTYMTWLITTYETILTRSLNLNFATDTHTGTREYSFWLREAKQMQAPHRCPSNFDGETPECLEAA